MGWTMQDFQECTRFGDLYLVKKVRDDGILVSRKVIRRKEKFFEEKPFVFIKITNIDHGMIPETDDLVYHCRSDKSTSLLKRSNYCPKELVIS